MKEKFDRGTALTIFRNDRIEDIGALVLSLVIAFLVYNFVGLLDVGKNRPGGRYNRQRGFF